MSTIFDSKGKQSLVILSLIFLLLAAAIAFAGWLSYNNFAEQLHNQVEKQLTVIASLKQEELTDWRNGRMAEAEILRQNRDFARQVEGFIKAPANPQLQAQLLAQLKSYRTIQEYDRISVLDTDGRVLLSDAGDLTPITASVAKRIPEVLKSRRAQMVDFYLRDVDQTARMVILVPITAEPGGEAIGLVALRINPQAYLFPYIQQWPIPSNSAETLLARREGADVLALNQPRFVPDGALAMRIPLTQTDITVVKAALGQTGILEGLDYRGEAVLAELRAIPNSPWLLVSKIDTAEVFAPLQARFWQTVIFFGALIFAVGAGLGIIWRQQGLRYYQRQVKILAALHENQERHRQISTLISDYAYGARLGTNGEIFTEWVSGAFEPITGYTPEEANALPEGFFSLILPEDIVKIKADITSLSRQPGSNEYRIRRKDGKTRWLRDHSRILAGENQADGVKVLGAVQDITDHKQAEEAVRESERRLSTLLSNLIGFAYRCNNDPDWTMEFVSNGCLELTGYAAADLMGNRTAAFGDVIHPDDRDMVWSMVQDGLTKRAPFQVEYRIITRDGLEKWVWEQGRGVFSGDTLEALEGYITDISELKNAQHQLLELNRSLEARVSERTAELQDLYDNAPIGYHSIDADGTLIMVNQTELNWLGYHREEVVGVKKFRDLLTPDSQQVFYSKFPEFKARGWARDIELDLLRKDGGIIPVLVNAAAIYDEQGNFLSSRSTLFDNSERKKAEIAQRESEAQNRLLFEESPDAVALLDELGRVIRANRAFETLTGYSQAQIIGHGLDENDLLTHKQVVQLRDLAAQHEQDHVASMEFSINRADGEHRDVGARVYQLSIHNTPHYLATMRDITTEKQTAETLRRANVALERAARAKDEFLANMSHELRTPLNAILNFSESMLENIYGPLNSRQHLPIRHIEAAGRHLLALINDILDLSKVESGRLELQLETVQVGDVCQASMLFVKELATKKSIKLGFQLNDQMAEMHADPKRLKQILVNLLSNAVKFTPDGGEVRLEVEATPETELIRFAVRDTGIGISPENMDLLFQPFVQIDSSLNRQYEGSGLGLALVRQLTDLHGGSLSVESQVNRGSCFTVTLPYRASLKSATDDGPLPDLRYPPASLPRTALVVEDSDSTAAQLTRYLHELNLKTVVHPSGKEALQQAIKFQPDVIILDLLLPDQTGWMVLEQLKAEPLTREIPVIIVSVVDEPVKGLSAGAAGYLVKPISREELRGAISVAGAGREQPSEVLVIASPPELPPPTGARILLAEDSEVNIFVISDYLTGKGYQVEVARDGQEALTKAQNARPDLILMDIQMPGIDGLEATRRLRATPGLADTPVIALTALAMPGDRKRCIEAGANEYIAKPAAMQTLVQTIDRLLNNATSSSAG